MKIKLDSKTYMVLKDLADNHEISLPKMAEICLRQFLCIQNESEAKHKKEEV